MSHQAIESFPEQIGSWFRRSSNRAKLLIIPLLIYEILFFLVPLAYLFRMSLQEPTADGVFTPGTWSIQGYINVLQSDLIMGMIRFTIEFTIAVTAVTLVLSVFMSYVLWRAKGWLKTMLLFSIILPLLTTLVVKLYAALLLLSPIGPINEALLNFGVVDTPVMMINNFFGTIIGQVYTAMPYATLAIYSVMSTIDWETVEAARDLGASRIRSFYEVVLPLSLPGITVGLVITFAWSVGAYASPALLGSASERTFAIEVERLLLRQFNWAMAGALSILLLVIVLISILLMFALLHRLGGEEMHV